MYHIPELQEENPIITPAAASHLLFLVFLMKIFSQFNNNQKMVLDQHTQMWGK